MEFDWNNYLEEIKSVAVAEELFGHVEASFDNGIKQGMLLEVCHKNNPDVYWIAKITMVCGHLLRANFIGADSDFWCDLASIKVRPLGWCGKYDELIEPPDEINQKYGDSIIEMMKKALSDGQSVSLESLNNKGMAPVDRIKMGMKVEIRNLIDPYRYWIATVCENVGGRLLLRYDGADEDLPQFWMFFCNPRISTFGFVTNKGSPWQFKYPGKVNKFSCKNKLSAQLRQSAEEAIKEPTPADLFQPNPTLEAHSFSTGMKVEALSPQDMKTFRPATVLKIFNNLHFLVVLDDFLEDYEDTKMAWMCDNMHPYIYPIGWAQRNKLDFKPPKTWKEGPFDWEEYLSINSAVPAPDYCFGNKEIIKGMEVNMKLEAVNPMKPEEIHIASIDAIVEHMVCVELLPIGEKYWFAQDSDLLLPVGWCDSSSYELHIPDTNKKEPPKQIEQKPKVDIRFNDEWCDRIFFNYKCYAGPSISRNKLSQLPKVVGPGPLLLVLKEVLNKIISASYKPAKLLKDWESEGPPEEGMQLEMLRAKLKTRPYHAYVAVATRRAQVEAFCRAACVRLSACPALFGPRDCAAACPHDCQRVDKSTFHNGTERRGRPKGSLNGRRKKKKVPEKRDKGQPQPEVEHHRDGESNGSDPSGGSHSDVGSRPNSPDSATDYKRNARRKREVKSNYPKMEMKTRGAKLPNFAIQMKESHWDKKDMATIYSNTCVRKKTTPESDTENDTNPSSCNSRDAKNISDVSDTEEPELKKLKFNTDDPLPSDNKMFEKDLALSWFKNKNRLSRNPLDWTVDDVYEFLISTDDCKLTADKMKQEEIDGYAFIMLDLHTITHFLHMKKEYAMQLCKHITMVRWYYLVNFEENGET